MHEYGTFYQLKYKLSTISNPNKTNNINSLNKVVLPRLHREKKGSTTSLSSGRPLLAQIDAQLGQKVYKFVCLFV